MGEWIRPGQSRAVIWTEIAAADLEPLVLRPSGGLGCHDLASLPFNKGARQEGGLKIVWLNVRECDISVSPLTQPLCRRLSGWKAFFFF